MYEAVHAAPDGDSSVARLAATAADYGFDGVVVRNHSDSRVEYDAEEIREASGIDVVEGVEVRAGDRQGASGSVGNVRTSNTIVAIHGGTNALNRFAVETDRVDVLAHPMTESGDFNHVLAKAAAENRVHLEFNLGRVLRDDGGPRVQAIQGLRKLRELVDQYDVPYVVSADPRSHLQLRAPRELLAVAETIGFDREAVEKGLSAWGEITARNRDRRSEKFIEPGVRIDDHEEDA